MKKLFIAVLIIATLSSCRALLYRKDACGRYPVLVPVHRTETSLSH